LKTTKPTARKTLKDNYEY